MSTADTVLRSVPVDRDGNPTTPGHFLATPAPAAPTREGASIPAQRHADPAGSEASVYDRPFDPQEFHRNLPKADTANLASIAQMTAGAPGVTTAVRQKPKVIYKGKQLKPITFDLDMPFEIDGVDYETVTIRSPAGEKYEEFQEVVQTHGADIAILWLVLDGTPPDAVEAIHVTDKAELKELTLPFLPRLIRRNLETEKAELLEEMTRTEASSNTAGSGQV